MLTKNVKQMKISLQLKLFTLQRKISPFLILYVVAGSNQGDIKKYFSILEMVDSWSHL